MATKTTWDIIESYLNCKYKGHLKLTGESGTKSDYETMATAARVSSREQAVAKLVARFDEGDARRGTTVTAATLKQGAPLLADAGLEDEGLSLRFDALKRADGASKLGEHHYLPFLHNHGDKVGQTQRLPGPQRNRASPFGQRGGNRSPMLTNWSLWFPDCEPVVHHLPVVFPARWVRFHSLPGSKRYPKSEAEYATVFERHNRVLGQLATPGESVALLTTEYSERAEPVRLQRELLELDPLALHWRTIAMHKQPDYGPDPNFWHVFASTRRWSPGVFDPLVRLIADDKLANVMIVALECRWLLHPYDGGMDVMVESKAARDSLANRFPEWLAPEWLAGAAARDVGLQLRATD
jgi:hypothetical protein